MSRKKYVPDGVWLTCDRGTCFSTFKVTFNKCTSIYGSNMATDGDRWPFLNVKPMGLCTMMRSLCIPSPVFWKDTKQGVRIGSHRMLLEDSTAKCLFGGTIQIHFTLEAAKAACPFGSLKRPSEYIKEGFDWVFGKIDQGLSGIREGLTKAGAPNWLLAGVDQLAWNAQCAVGIVEGAVNAVVGLGEVIWDITQDPVGIGTAICEGVADGATKAWEWVWDGENWENAAESSWDFVTSPDKWADAAQDADKWMRDNPRKAGNVTGEVLQTAAEIAFTGGAASAVRKTATETLERGAREVTERGVREVTEKTTKELTERGVRETAEGTANKALSEVFTKEGIDEALERTLRETAEQSGKKFAEVKKAFKKLGRATNKQKGNFGEIASHNNLVNNPALREKGYNLKCLGGDDHLPPKGLNDKIRKGIDGIYENIPSPPPPKFVIDEAKFGRSRFGKTKYDGPQMSNKWVRKRLDDAVGKNKADEIREAMENGEVDKVVSKVDKDGNVKTYRVGSKSDTDNSIGTLWP